MKPGPRPKGAPLIADVTLAAVTREWSDAAAIAARIEGWAFVTVKNNLFVLHKEGAVETRYAKVGRAYAYEYRLPEAKDG